MTTSLKNDIEFEEIFELFSSRTARLLPLNYLKERHEVSIVWRLNFVDESGRATLVLCDQACTELIGKDARDVVALQGEPVKTLPISVELDIVGRKGLFEVIVTPDNNDAERFEVSRLTLDKEILDLYRDKYCFYQESSPDHPSFPNDSTYTSPDDLDIGYSSADQAFVVCDEEAEEQPRFQEDQGMSTKNKLFHALGGSKTEETRKTSREDVQTTRPSADQGNTRPALGRVTHRVALDQHSIECWSS
ncbi:hypothetical protein CASFOL_005084 [Castilleja foliolosa]|uniref:Uncharacterized protein n=1 Tax=Castilleja foliolosa TaxID=1961234 RepID=A0ABD3E2H7_9LAMI